MSTILKKFDDLTRCSNVLTEGIEQEFHKCVTEQEKCRKKWQEAEKENHETKKYFAKYKADQDTLELKLKLARHQLDDEMKKRLKAEQSLEQMSRQLELIKELLLDKDCGAGLSDEDKHRLAKSIHEYHAESRIFSETNLHQEESMYTDEQSSVELGESNYDISADDILDDTGEGLLDGNRRKSKRPLGPTAPPMDEPSSTDGSEGYSSKRTRMSTDEDSSEYSARVTKTTTASRKESSEVKEWFC